MSLVGLAFAGGLVVLIWLVPSLPLAALLFGLLVALLWGLRDVLRPPAGFPGPRLRAWWPPLLVTGLALFRMWPASIGAALVRNDHSIHAFKGLVMADELLPKGTLSAWSHAMFAGYPAGELYPPAGELWVALADFLTFKTLSAPTVYALAFTAFFAFAGLALYAFGKHFGGRWVGLLAAVFLLFDHGEFRQAGWHYVVTYGVWAQSFGLAWFLLAFVRFDRLLSERRLRDVLLFGLCAGLSVLAHPMGLLTMALALPLHLLLWWLRAGGRLRDVVGPVFLGLAIAGLLAASWLLPFVVRKSLTVSIGVVWDAMGLLGKRFLTGDLFGGTAAFVSVLAVVGMAMTPLDRRALRPTSALLALLFVFLSTSTVVVDFDLVSLSDSFRKIQYERFMTQAKPFWFVLAAFALVRGLSAAWTRWKERTERSETPQWRGLLYAFLFAALAFGATRPALDAGGREYVGKHPRTALTWSPWKDYEEAAAWLRGQAPDEWWRLAVVDSEHAHDLFLLAGLVERPTVKIGFTPAENYRFRLERTDYELLHRLGVRYLVSKNKRTHRLLDEPQRFGSLWVHPFKDPGLAPYELSGGGEVELEAFADEWLALRLSGTSEKGRLKILVGYHPRWEARLDGTPVALREVPYKGKEHSLHVLETDAKDGLLELRFRPQAVDRVATASGWAALLLLGLLALLSTLPPLRRRVWDPVAAFYARHRGRIGMTLLGIGAGVAVALAGVLALGASRGEAGERRLFRASDESASAQVWYRAESSGRDLACTDWTGRRWTCEREETNWRFVGPVVISFADLPTRCVWAHPIEGRVLEIRYPDVPLGRAVAGYVGIEDKAVRKKGSKGAAVTMTLLVDGEAVGEVKQRNVEGTKDFRFALPEGSPERGALTVQVTSPDDHWRNFCYEAWTLE